MLRFACEVLAAGLGTLAFAVLFHVPGRYYLRCALTGAAGWLLFLALRRASPPFPPPFSPPWPWWRSAAFSSVQRRCPVTIFLISGIFPLVPGLGIYHTAYYTVTGDLAAAGSTGFFTIKTAAAMVLAICWALNCPPGCSVGWPALPPQSPAPEPPRFPCPHARPVWAFCAHPPSAPHTMG